MPVRCWLPLRSQLQWAFVSAYLCETLQPSLLASQFQTWVHFSGIALSYNITVTLISGFAPLAAAALIRRTRTGNPASLALCMAGTAATTFVPTFLIRKPHLAITPALAAS